MDTQKKVKLGEHDGLFFTLYYTTYWENGEITYEFNIDKFKELLGSKNYNEIIFEDLNNYCESYEQSVYNGNTEYEGVEGIDSEEYDDFGFDNEEDFLEYLYGNYDISECEYQFDRFEIISVEIID